MSVPKRQWGKSEIAGGRHAYRLGLLMKEVRRWMAPGSKVLDAGCGDGGLTVMLAREGYEVSAVDASADCIARLAERIEAGQAGGRTVRHCRAGLESIPFPDCSFDAVVSGEVLEHLEDDGAAAWEFYRLLVPGGLAIISVPSDPGKWGLEDEWAGHQRRYTADALRGLLEGAGFETLLLRHWGWPVTYLYNRFLFRAWLKRRLAQGDADPSGASSPALHPLVSRAMALAFSVDNLFQWTGFGIGLLAMFRKPESPRPDSRLS